MRFSVLQERLHVGARMVDTGKGLRIHKIISERKQAVDPPLLQEELVVEHIPVGAVLEEGEMLQTRYEGDTLIVPIVEEVLVVRKQLRLREEVRITRRRQQTHAPQTVLLRTEHVAVERFDEGNDQRA